jgi:4,5-dihydroxyphthalate decarboxylase
MMLPWLSNLLDEDRRLLGDDWWPYGVAANRKAIDTFLRYHFEQGLSRRLLACEDIFAQELLTV